ncbi:gpW family head-tail joining protein [Pseudoalteromonas ulvae]|uniref:Phage tail protein n=1 Tax=Pseudoalteromonas ulvae TaxID=107327 RepID=A0A244CUG7_PSEDV|nr:gpW family head-tail joining protein [Pseudoalteromonas ulvae]OUL59257.1 hypothetical protein B1199_03030 [Pseudoalteromonas ulvae]
MTTLTTAQKLAEAQNAYHQLITGTATVAITRNGRAVTFSQANKADLLAYIDELKRELGQTSSRRRGPMGVFL